VSHTMHIQQQEAQDLVTRCATVLQQCFGAKRVIPFGSVVVDGALRARILGEKPISEEPFRALKELVEDELAPLEQIVQAMQEGMSSLDAAPITVRDACARQLSTPVLHGM
jgi:hypothetical protein